MKATTIRNSKTICNNNAANRRLTAVVVATLFATFAASVGGSDQNDVGCTNSAGDDASSNLSNECKGEAVQAKQEHLHNAEAKNSEQCGLYLAESTIPNAGLGTFIGAIHIDEGQIVPFPDIVIPIFDVDWHNDGKRDKEDYHWLLVEYDWLADDLLMSHEAQEVSGFVPGFGAAPNCHLELRNVEEWYPTYDALGLHRSRDPGVGGFTGYYNRSTVATRAIAPGSEVFVNYGEHWFESRENYFSLVPLKSSYRYAGRFLTKYEAFLGRQGDAMTADMKNDLWDIIKSLPFESRTRNALPVTSNDAEHAIEVGLTEHQRTKSTRSLEWLSKHGKCMDNIHPENSTIPQAGRGAFATRFIPKGGLVAPAPLIHIPDLNTLTIYDEKITESGKSVRDTSKVLGYQLLLNYCFGHPDSSLLLCPYSSTMLLINHSKSPNAKIIWAEDSSNHNAEWFNRSVHSFKKEWRAGLAFDVVATRDIEPGEEVFIDYGTEWEEAWDEHVTHWEPVEDADNYVHSSDLNNDVESLIRTKEEQLDEPYPENLELRCYYAPRKRWQREWVISDINEPEDGNAQEWACTILSRDIVDGSDGSKPMYTAEMLVTNDYGREERHEVTKIPREGIFWSDVEYTGNEHLHAVPNAFRHKIGIPEDMFPQAWKNYL